MGLTKTANAILERIAESHVDDLCNAVAGMSYTERKEFVNSLVARAPAPMKQEMSLAPIETWWGDKIRSGIMLTERPEEL